MTLAMLAQVACTEPTADEEEVREANQGMTATNALGDNALGDNALGDNALGDNALGDNALTSSALGNNAQLQSALADPLARELFTYIVSCALPAEKKVSVNVAGTTYDFDGALGVAPEWGESGGTCDEECKSWVSACVIARLDYLGQTLTISLRGQNPALKTTPQERAQYSRIEATYYGNIFSEPKEIYACLPHGKHSIPRVCGPSLNDCIVDVQGKCDHLCGDQLSDGAYPSCREASSGCHHGKTHKGEKHVGSVTVFLKQ